MSPLIWTGLVLVNGIKKVILDEISPGCVRKELEKAWDVTFDSLFKKKKDTYG